MHSQILDVDIIIVVVVILFTCCKNACCVKKVSLSGNPVKFPLPLCPCYCHIRLATLRTGVGPPSNALYTSTQGAVNKIHSDVLASERLQSETACVHHLL